VARVEGLGPVTLTELRELLARTELRIQPVIDLADRVRGTAYEHTESLKERVHLATGGDYWPYATSTNRTVDYDHPTPYRHPPDGQPPEPGQTGTHNSGPLGRRHHRWKTHAGYRARQAGEGRYAWLTPHGLGYLVDHRGTQPIPTEQARMIIDAPRGVDMYRPTPRARGHPARGCRRPRRRGPTVADLRLKPGRSCPSTAVGEPWRGGVTVPVRPAGVQVTNDPEEQLSESPVGIGAEQLRRR
jgi:hypothetical protein